jgi:uncharacterized surface anchored protein
MHLAVILALLLTQAPAGAIEVRALDADTGRPLNSVKITLIRPADRTGNQTGVTGAEGIYTFSDLDEGSYILILEHEGYLPQTHQSINAANSPSPDTINVTRGVLHVTYQLARAANISGRIYDAQREPAAGADVQLLQRRYDNAGRTVLGVLEPAINNLLLSVKPMRSDERGDYELDGIPPGAYYIRATSSGRTSYFPGVTQVDEAIPISIEPGVHLRNIDFAFVEPKGLQISGRVSDGCTTGEHSPIEYRLIMRNARVRSSDDGVVVNQEPLSGRFRFKDVSPGAYELYAGYKTDDITRWGCTGHVGFEADDRDLDELTVTVQDGHDIDGVVQIADTTVQEPPENLPLPVLTLAEPLPAVLEPNLTSPVAPLSDVSRKAFSIPHVAGGRYRLSFTYLPERYYVSAARLGGHDILNQAFEISGDSGPLVIELSEQGAVLQGIARRKEGNIASGATIYLAPAIQRDERLLYKTVQADAQGQFTVRGAAPGSYTVFAFLFSRGPFRIDEVMNAEFMTPYLNNGISLDLQAGQIIRMDLTAIPIP